MQRKSILKDTIQLTVVQFFLEWVSLLLNVWLTHRIGAATVGIVALTGSFFQLAAVAANGNGFLCTSRFVSEELGKPNGNPNRVLGYAIDFHDFYYDFLVLFYRTIKRIRMKDHSDSF